MPDMTVQTEAMRFVHGSRIIYLHGFRSSALSFKAVWLHDRLREMGLAARFSCPQLPPSPREAVALVLQQFDIQPDDTVVGSSLGGYYATWIAERTGCRAVLLNPVVAAVRDLSGLVGEHKMYHSNDSFRFLQEYLAELADMAVPVITFAQRYFLIAAKGDELLDWREMTSHYQGARQLVLSGSDHGLSDFPDYGDEVLRFAGLFAERT